MKKLLTLTAACALLTTPATAVQKCVALNADSDIRCHSSNRNLFKRHVDWSTTCGDIDNISGVPIKGIAACSYVNYLSNDSVLVYPIEDGVSNNQRYCWCKVISPAISGWVLYDDGSIGQDFEDSEDCLTNCASSCAEISWPMNEEIFKNLTD